MLVIWWQVWWDRGAAARHDSKSWGSCWRRPGGQDQDHVGCKGLTTEAGEPEQERTTSHLGGESSMGMGRLSIATRRGKDGKVG